MRAVIFKGPGKVVVEDRPIPTIKEPQDIIIKVLASALCGSELHIFRGLEECPPGVVMGHEFTGIVEELGSAVKNFQKGDKVVVPFTISCGECFYCRREYSSRCVKSQVFGTPGLDGGQAEYVRIPLADATAVKAPDNVADNALLLMADIFPTGFSGAYNAFKQMTREEISQSTVVVIGCGPVGLCAIINAEDYKPKHLFAIDSVESRLEQARKLGAEPLNFQTDREGMLKRILEVTEGKGADVVIEVVGLSPALRTGFDILRPFGILSSVGVHNGEIPWTGAEAYNKNLRLLMGRCPVRSLFPLALEMLAKKQELVGFMFDHLMPLSQAVEAYELFNQMKVQKVVFEPQA